ncbi:MAG: 4Fe-4S dicluster domain-containing protein [Dehalococcoidia bacterium]|nr:4Fe-4S dicluster domain-containing protein [Dehalococcoidia bacterium]
MWQKLCFMTLAEESPGAGAALAERPTATAEAEDDSFAEEVYSLPGGEGVRWCIQCGICSASCPNVARMEYSPRRTIAMIRAGRRNDVLNSNSPWICASCYLCTVRCPRGVKPTELMHALERLSTRYGTHSRRVSTPAMYRAFVNSIKNNGRVHEVGLMMEYYRKTNPISALRMSSVGLGLLRHGRLSLKASKIKGVGQINAMLKKAESLGGAK